MQWVIVFCNFEMTDFGKQFSPCSELNMRQRNVALKAEVKLVALFSISLHSTTILAVSTPLFNSRII